MATFCTTVVYTLHYNKVAPTPQNHPTLGPVIKSLRWDRTSQYFNFGVMYWRSNVGPISQASSQQQVHSQGQQQVQPPGRSHSVTQSLFHLTTLSLNHSVTQSLFYSTTQSRNRSVTQPLNLSITQSLNHSVTPQQGPVYARPPRTGQNNKNSLTATLTCAE